MYYVVYTDSLGVARFIAQRNAVRIQGSTVKWTSMPHLSE